jgi:FHS family L-fucose permease-like MFS transporter
LHSEALRVIAPYLVLAAATLTMMVLIASVRFPASLAAEEDRGPGSHRTAELLRRPHFVMAVAAQFAYVGAQVGTWSYLIPYIQAYTGEAEKFAGYCLTGSLVLFGVGRFFSAWLMRFVQPSRLMAVYAVINTVLAIVGVLFPGWTGTIALLLTSFFMSLMFPTIFAQGIRGLGETAKLGGSLIVMAIIGGAVLTPVMGLLSVHSGGLAIAYLVPAFAYVLIAFYSFADVRLGKSGGPAAVAGDA